MKKNVKKMTGLALACMLTVSALSGCTVNVNTGEGTGTNGEESSRAVENVSEPEPTATPSTQTAKYEAGQEVDFAAVFENAIPKDKFKTTVDIVSKTGDTDARFTVATGIDGDDTALVLDSENTDISIFAVYIKKGDGKYLYYKSTQSQETEEICYEIETAGSTSGDIDELFESFSMNLDKENVVKCVYDGNQDGYDVYNITSVEDGAEVDILAYVDSSGKLVKMSYEDEASATTATIDEFSISEYDSYIANPQKKMSEEEAATSMTMFILMSAGMMPGENAEVPESSQETTETFEEKGPVLDEASGYMVKMDQFGNYEVFKETLEGYVMVQFNHELEEIAAASINMENSEEIKDDIRAKAQSAIENTMK